MVRSKYVSERIRPKRNAISNLQQAIENADTRMVFLKIGYFVGEEVSKKWTFFTATENFVRGLCGCMRLVLKNIQYKTWNCRLPHSQGGTISIFANGPSLSDVLIDFDRLEEFRGVDFAVVNFFIFSAAFTKIRPKHYCLFDPAFFNDVHPTFPKTLEMLALMDELVDWPMNLYIPLANASSFREKLNLKNTNIVITPVNTIRYQGSERWSHFFFRNNLAMPDLQNVSVAIVFLAINLGYSQINLYGMELSFLEKLYVDNDNVVYLRDQHFYNVDAPMEPLFKDDMENRFTMFEILDSTAKAFKAHEQLRAYADSRQVRILNCTKNSFIDAYERRQAETQ